LFVVTGFPAASAFFPAIVKHLPLMRYSILAGFYIVFPQKRYYIQIVKLAAQKTISNKIIFIF